MPRVTGLVELADVEKAAARLEGRVHRTPVMTARGLSDELGCRITLKAELFQRTGSFKIRGATNAALLLDEEARRRGLVTLSAGNHAIALAGAAREVGTTATVVMPATASPMKVAVARSYGARVVLTEEPLIEVAHRERDEHGLTLVHPFDDPHIIAGAGGVGLEIAQQVPDADVVVVPIGGGGLISGVAVAIRALLPNARVIGVEPRGADGMTRSLAAGTPQSVVPSTVADGLAAPFAGEHTLRHVQALVDEVVIVDDDDIAVAFRALHARAKLAVEPSAAAGLAALSRYPEMFAGKAVALVVSGGNVDPTAAARLLAA